MTVIDAFETIRQNLVADRDSIVMRQRGWQPVYTASASAMIAVIGQAPGWRAQTSGVPWDDASGKNLIDWLGVTEKEFRNPNLFALLPMDFYYPGTGRSGDLPPRKGFAEQWHPPLLALMPKIRLTLLIGRYAQIHYLPLRRRGTLTDTVRDYRQFTPQQFPLVHPSPLNFRWHMKNPWFVTDVLPQLRTHVRSALDSSSATDLTRDRPDGVDCLGDTERLATIAGGAAKEDR
jgi:uracil-DNA glycosylase